MPPEMQWLEFGITLFEVWIVWEILRAEKKSLTIEQRNLELYDSYFKLRSGWLSARLRTLRKDTAGAGECAEGESCVGAATAEASSPAGAAGGDSEAASPGTNPD